MQLVGKTNIDFIGMRVYAYILSAILILLGIVSLGLMAFGQADLSIDFSGGTYIRGAFDQSVSVGDVRSALAKQGYTDASIQSVIGSTPNTFIIKVAVASAGGADDQSVAKQLENALATAFPGNKFTVDSVQEVGPTIGKQLQQQAAMAMAIAMVGILIYIMIRFDFRFSVAAAVSTFHDILAVLGIMFILQREFSLLVLSALLTLIGYSLQDKVVVFDRIRENLRMFRKKGDFVETVNLSINQVLSRTLVTQLNAIICILVILFFCGPVVRDFALALAIGMLVGTYSSIFVASTIVVEWEARSPKRFK
jgi:preprotein translocase subunit SecF